MKRRARLSRLLLLALMLSQSLTWSVIGTQAPQWMQGAALGVTVLLAIAWFRS